MTVWLATKTLDGLIDHVETCASKSDAEVLLVGGKAIDLDEFPRLQGIFKTGVGTDNLPFAEAEKRGIEIALPTETTRQIIFRETADFTCHLILRCLYRNTGDWETWHKAPRHSLRTRNVLVIGTGNIGGIVRDSMTQFCRVTTYDTVANTPDELPALMEQADCVSLHIPLNDQTKNFVDAEKLSWMKDGAALVNTSRGPVVDEDSLLPELRNGRLFAALDVFAKEPYDGPLNRLPSDAVLLTPHVASTCSEFLEGTAQDFCDFLQRLRTHNNAAG